ncbi:MAG: guanine deaminase [Nitratireductor sp.]|nr:guanine deaminase [Nitratireductor sp.]
MTNKTQSNRAAVLLGQVLTFLDDPAIVGEERSHTCFETGAVVIDAQGTIAWVGDRNAVPDEYAAYPQTDHGKCLIMPGFIDAHLHFPQYRMLAAYGKDLLDWLNRYTFIEEQRYGDAVIAADAAGFFLDELLANGTTSCLAFSTIHPVALDALFTAATEREMAVISGKTMMDCNAPSGLTDTPQTAYDDSSALIAKWHGHGRLQYAITPRFAVTSSEAQMEVAGTLKQEHPELVFQTHLSENHAEIETVARAFPWSKDYTDVYDRYGLLSERAFFAHGIHLSERELLRLSETGASIVHCPTSNNFLGSGLFRYHHTRQADRPVSVAIGSDIGGGTSYSMLQTMRDAYVVSQLAGSRISAFDAFYLATLGNARLLHLDDEIGKLEPGKLADIIVLDPDATPAMAVRNAISTSLHDILFALLIMGDDRAVRETYVRGKPSKRRK